MSALCDANVLLALTSSKHTHHASAVAWAEGVQVGGLQICRLVQLTLLRLLCNSSVMQEDTLTMRQAWEAWTKLMEDSRMRLLTEEPALFDDFLMKFSMQPAASPGKLDDAYLAALAQGYGLTLVTFDRGFRSFEGLRCKVLDGR